MKWSGCHKRSAQLCDAWLVSRCANHNGNATITKVKQHVDRVALDARQSLTSQLLARHIRLSPRFLSCSSTFANALPPQFSRCCSWSPP